MSRFGEAGQKIARLEPHIKMSSLAFSRITDLLNTTTAYEEVGENFPAEVTRKNSLSDDSEQDKTVCNEAKSSGQPKVMDTSEVQQLTRMEAKDCEFSLTKSFKSIAVFDNSKSTLESNTNDKQKELQEEDTLHKVKNCVSKESALSEQKREENYPPVFSRSRYKTREVVTKHLEVEDDSEDEDSFSERSENGVKVEHANQIFPVDDRTHFRMPIPVKIGTSDKDITGLSKTIEKKLRAKTPGARRKSAKPMRLRVPEERGTVAMSVKVKTMDLLSPVVMEDQLEVYQAKVLQFYDLILQDSPLYAVSLSSQPVFCGCHVENISLGSLKAKIKCPTEQALLNLQEKIHDGSLEEVFNEVIVTDELLEDLDISGMTVFVEVKDAIVKQCQRELAYMEKQARKEEDNVNQPLSTSVTKSKIGPIPRPLGSTGTCCSGGILVPNILNSKDLYSAVQCKNRLNVIREQLRNSDVILQDCLRVYENNIENLLLTLRLVKPRQLKSFSSLKQVVACYAALKKSPSVGQSVRTDLVGNFLDTISQGRLSITKTQNLIKEAEINIAACFGVGIILKWRKFLNSTLDITSEDHEFANATCSLSVKLNVMDEELFGKMLSYLPSLVENHLHCSRTIQENIREIVTTS